MTMPSPPTGGKWTSASTALGHLQRGQKIFVGSGAAEPQALVKALTEKGHDLADLEIFHLLTLGIAPYTNKDYQHIFRHNALYVGANVRKAVAEGRADYTPVFLSEIPHLFRRHRIHLNAALIQVSPPDQFGFCSFGVSVDVVKSAARYAELVIAEVNPRMPRCLGDSFIHVNDIDFMVWNESPLPESLPTKLDDDTHKIGQYIASLIEDGSTLQMGIGSIPNAVLEALGDKKDLGVHTEMFSDGIINLVESGVINGARKNLLPGKIVASFCMGSQALYNYVDNNPRFEFRPVEFTNDPFMISRNDRMVAINAALEVDLTGQVCSDSIGQRFYSGIGGQVDFIRGAARSNDGKPIIALRSTAKNDTISRITSQLQPGAGVVTTRGDVHYVVTEYGVANLWGKSVRERTMALISIAHPKFRDQLLETAKEKRLVYADQIVVAAEYPDELTETTTFKDTEVHFRPLRADDESALKTFFYGLSQSALAQRFFTAINVMPHERLQQFTNVDYRKQMTIAGFVNDDQDEKIIAVSDYHFDPASGFADIAFLVSDQFQHRGIGSHLLQKMSRIAKKAGIKGFVGDVMPENQAMLKVFHQSGLALSSSLQDGVIHVVLTF